MATIPIGSFSALVSTNNVIVNMVAQKRSMFFFFQAEDGIRDADVTGVQTCALPIFMSDTTNSEPDTLPASDPRNRLYAKLGLVHSRSRCLRNHHSSGSSMVAVRRDSHLRGRQRTKESRESRR